MSRSIPLVLQGSIPGNARNDLHCNFSVTFCLAGIDFDRQAADFVLVASKSSVQASHNSTHFSQPLDVGQVVGSGATYRWSCSALPAAAHGRHELDQSIFELMRK
jgi:hypothetical protein